MSSGGVDNEGWMEEGIPLLKNRLLTIPPPSDTAPSAHNGCDGSPSCFVCSYEAFGFLDPDLYGDII